MGGGGTWFFVSDGQPFSSQPSAIFKLPIGTINNECIEDGAERTRVM
jgi:hypothetical protein